MKRNYLKVGDKSTANGVVVEGIPFCSHEGTEITFVGAKVSCPSCHSIGHIVATGPRLPMKMMGKDRALEGDLCACKCDPQPTRVPSQSNMGESFDSNALASMGFGSNGLPIGTSTSPHWIKFVLSEKGNCEGLQCAAHSPTATSSMGRSMRTTPSGLQGRAAVLAHELRFCKTAATLRRVPCSAT